MHKPESHSKWNVSIQRNYELSQSNVNSFDSLCTNCSFTMDSDILRCDYMFNLSKGIIKELVRLLYYIE